MNHPYLISIDWDHTFRNLAGLDLGILALALYAKSKQIPVGITTHRDIENTTLYTLYYWQYEKPKNISEALAAAISYWNEHLFKPLHLEFDFINARYQPRYAPENYYQKILYPLEKQLKAEITEQHILDNFVQVQEKIHEYAQVETYLEHNEFKEAQMLWLSHYTDNQPLTVYHIDDSKEVCDHLQSAFKHLSPDAPISFQTVFYEKSPFFSNESCLLLLEKTGLLADMQLVVHDLVHAELIFENQLRGLSACLAVILSTTENIALANVETLLKKTKPHLLETHHYLHGFISQILTHIKIHQQPIFLFPNHLSLDIAEESPAL